MTNEQARMLRDAIREHARAMVAERLWAQAEAGTDVNYVVADADALLAALSASSGGDGQSESQVANATPGREPGQGSKEAATPPPSADLVTVRRADLVLYLDNSNRVEMASAEWDADLLSALQHLREAASR